MIDKTAKDRVARHTEKRKKAGWCRVNVWAKNQDDRLKIIEYAKRLRGDTE